MSKKMLVNAIQHEENRVAIVEDGILTELDIEVAGHEPTKGNIYKAVVVRVEAGLQAAFVDYGAERLGFLQIDEVNYYTVKPDYAPSNDGRHPKINDLLSRGQEILVQIIKEERGTKGAALTTYLSLAGRYMVIMPGSRTRGVSRKAESDSQRKELKKAMSSLDLAENIGYIVRTAALNQSRDELDRDYRYLLRLYESLLELNTKLKAPSLLYKESNLIIRSIRDYFTVDMDEVLIDDLQVFKEAKDFFQMVMPDCLHLVKLHQEKRPIFSRYQIEDQIETIHRNKVPLPSGGSIVIDSTEALVAIDVNSGKMASEQGVEATATKTNLEAAREIGRQLRLRDLGGLVVIDFIDMRERKHMKEVEEALKTSFSNDKAKVNIGRISPFGLLEMSRQRIKASLATGSYLSCPHCQGAGRLKSPEVQAASILRKIHAGAAKSQVTRIDAQMPMDVAAYLLNYKREDLFTMERDHHVQIHIHGNRDFISDQVEIEIQKKEKEPTQTSEFIAAGIVLPSDGTKEKEPAEQSDQIEKKGPDTDPAKKRRRRKRPKPADLTVSPDSVSSVDQTSPLDEEQLSDVRSEDKGIDVSKEGTVPVKAEPQKHQKQRRTRRTKTKETNGTDTANQSLPNSESSGKDGKPNQSKTEKSNTSRRTQGKAKTQKTAKENSADEQLQKTLQDGKETGDHLSEKAKGPAENTGPKTPSNSNSLLEKKASPSRKRPRQPTQGRPSSKTAKAAQEEGGNRSKTNNSTRHSTGLRQQNSRPENSEQQNAQPPSDMSPRAHESTAGPSAEDPLQAQQDSLND
jgi:ribonuclease E